MRAGVINWWHDRIRHRGPALWFASATTANVKCSKITHSFSVVFEEGIRVYAFTSAFERDTFCAHYDALACENPYPIPGGPDIPADTGSASGDTSESLDDAGQ